MDTAKEEITSLGWLSKRVILLSLLALMTFCVTAGYCAEPSFAVGDAGTQKTAIQSANKTQPTPARQGDLGGAIVPKSAKPLTSQRDLKSRLNLLEDSFSKAATWNWEQAYSELIGLEALSEALSAERAKLKTKWALLQQLEVGKSVESLQADAAKQLEQIENGIVSGEGASAVDMSATIRLIMARCQGVTDAFSSTQRKFEGELNFLDQVQRLHAAALSILGAPDANNAARQILAKRIVQMNLAKGTPKDASSAEGDSRGQSLLGIQFYNGVNRPVSYEQSLALAKKSAASNDPLGAWLLARHNFLGLGISCNTPEASALMKTAFSRLSLAAQAGDPVAEYALGISFLEGMGTPASGENACDWLRKSASHGFSSAKVILAKLLEEGRLLPKDLREATNLYQEAANAGESQAMLRLANMLLSGVGAERNLPQAVVLLRQAAELGVASAMQKLAECYEKGAGVLTDPASAAAWYKKAIEAGDNASWEPLGWIYY
ncbi:MAG: tetratricopeptide repeat protein, partial [Chthoniobacteraceae bacterium]|nr:tetratricopeptide repeat protein [Chthoniobacteraceae bacterium]